MLKLYENIKSRRLELGLTQSQLAEKLGYADKSMIAKIEAGQVDLPLSKISAFAKALYVEPGELMGWDEEEANYYLSAEAAQLAQELYTRPEIRVLFDASRNATTEDIQMAADLLDRLSKK